MSEANERQVGGDHYQKGAQQHWDLCVRWDLPYLESAASKYLLRWREKGGLESVEKAIHYLEKRTENFDTMRFVEARSIGGAKEIQDRRGEVIGLAIEHGLTDGEANIVSWIMVPYSRGDILGALAVLRKFLKEQRELEAATGMAGPGTPEDGGHHARQDGPELELPGSASLTEGLGYSSLTLVLPPGSRGEVTRLGGSLHMTFGPEEESRS